MMKILVVVIGMLLLASSAIQISGPSKSLRPDMYVAEVLYARGVDAPRHYRPVKDSISIERGRQLVLFGKTQLVPAGKSSAPISKFYTCTSCHNIVREDPDLRVVDPAARLEWAAQRGLPFLQASTFWGISDRKTWYNGDYLLKYGSLVEEARHSLEASTQLCAQVCSQGRALEDWEMESILAYYSSLGMRLEDLGLDAAALSDLSEAPDSVVVARLQSLYLDHSPATFVDPPADKTRGYGLAGDAERGALIYKLGCQHCHHEGGESDVILDDYRSTFRWLKRHMADAGPLSIYEIIRHGTYAEAGHRPYMPHYTLEKMSDQQVEDLRAYIEMRADGGH